MRSSYDLLRRSWRNCRTDKMSLEAANGLRLPSPTALILGGNNAAGWKVRQCIFNATSYKRVLARCEGDARRQDVSTGKFLGRRDVASLCSTGTKLCDGNVKLDSQSDCDILREGQGMPGRARAAPLLRKSHKRRAASANWK